MVHLPSPSPSSEGLSSAASHRRTCLAALQRRALVMMSLPSMPPRRLIRRARGKTRQRSATRVPLLFFLLLPGDFGFAVRLERQDRVRDTVGANRDRQRHFIHEILGTGTSQLEFHSRSAKNCFHVGTQDGGIG